MEKYIVIQKDVYYNYIDFKKVLSLSLIYHIWYKGLWSCMTNFSISQEIINIIKSLYVNSNREIILNNMTVYLFHTTVGVRQGCLLSPMFINICLEQIMQYKLKNHKSSNIFVGGK